MAGRLAGIGAGLLIAAASASLAGCGSAVASSAASAGAATASTSAAALQAQYERVIKTVLPSVVQLSTPVATGSGVVFDGKGDIVTNAHVVGTARTVQVTSDVSGTTVTATVVGVYEPDDLAVVRVTSGAGSLPAARFGRSATVPAGEIVLALGSPLGLIGSATQGIISATGRTLIETDATPGGGTKTTTIAGTLQTSAAINSGNSGGALVSLSGQVIGMPTATSVDAGDGQATGIGFAIPSDTVTSIARQLIAAGRVTSPGRATLGLSARSASSAPGHQDGVSVTAVAAGGPAATAGLRPGDVITRVEGSSIQTASQLAALLAALRPGMQVYLTYTQSGAVRTANVTLGTSWS